MADANEISLYEAVGGMPFFERLVGRFYEGVASDPVLRPMYPEDDLTQAARRLTLFLVQYWGGPPTYAEERGNPRLRMRHAGFPIDDEARDRWLTHMRAAVDALAPPEEIREPLVGYLEMAADSMRNRV